MRCRKAKSVALNKEGYFERQISMKLKFSKTAIYQAIVKFRNFRSFQDLNRSGKSKVTSQRDDHLIKWMVVCGVPSKVRNLRKNEKFWAKFFNFCPLL